jgi:hypothetical protein
MRKRTNADKAYYQRKREQIDAKQFTFGFRVNADEVEPIRAAMAATGLSGANFLRRACGLPVKLAAAGRRPIVPAATLPMVEAALPTVESAAVLNPNGKSKKLNF